MKYYIYVSDSKLEMLSAQLSSRHNSSVETSVKVGLKDFLGMERKTTVEKEQSKYQKLDEVIEHLDKTSQIGTIENPKAFIRGTHKMRWGIFDIAPNHPRREFGDKAPVVFHGIGKAVIFLLFGSPIHLIGSVKPQRSEGIWSASDTVYYALGKLSENENLPTGDGFQSKVNELMRITTTNSERLEVIWDEINQELKAPMQNLEFVAKTLIHCYLIRQHGKPALWKDGDKTIPIRIVFASPLYVALAE